MFTSPNEERNAEIIRRRRAGALPRDIAKIMNLSRNVVIGVCHRAGLSDAKAAAMLRGEECSWAKLTPERVRRIRTESKTDAVWAAEFGVCEETIREARHRRTWAHVA